MHDLIAAPESFSPMRSLGMAVALTLHIGAGLMLFSAGDSNQEPPLAQAEPLIFDWIVPLKPTPPPPAPPMPPAPPRPVLARVQAPPAPPVTVETPSEWVEPVAVVPSPEPTTDFISPPQTAPSGPAEISQLQYARAPGAPRYPAPAIRAGQEGTVLLRIHVDADGRPTHVEVAQSSGHRLLDRAAVDYAMRQLRFKPAQRDGRPVSAIAQVPVAFALPGRA